MKTEENKKIYMVYDWANENIELLSYNKTKILAKIGEYTLAGGIMDNYKIIEINLDEVEDD